MHVELEELVAGVRDAVARLVIFEELAGLVRVRGHQGPGEILHHDQVGLCEVERVCVHGQGGQQGVLGAELELVRQSLVLLLHGVCQQGHELVIDRLRLLWLKELHLGAQNLPTLKILFPEAIGYVDHGIAFELLEYVLHPAGLGLALTGAPELGGLRARGALNLLEDLDYQRDIGRNEQAER